MMEYDLPGPAREISERAVLYAEQHEVETLRQYIVAMLGRIAALEGRWDEAEAVLREAVASGSSVPLILALTALALLQVRRGDDESAATLERAWPLVEAAGEPQRIVPLVEVEAERAWLAGRLDESVRHLRDGYALVERVGRRHGRLARWLQEAGLLAEVPPGVSEPHLAELEGRWAEAAAMWRERGMPYEEAMALARTGEAGRNEAIEIAERLGAAPLAAAPAGRAWRLDAQELGLGRLELLVGQEALGLEVAEALQPADHVGLRSRRRSRSWGGGGAAGCW